MTELETGREGRNGSTMTLPADAMAVANDVGQKAASAAQVTARSLDDALKRLDQESEGTLTIGAAFSLGLASGLLIGGGPRLLAVVAGAPGVAMALTLLRRTEAIQGSRSVRPAKA